MLYTKVTHIENISWNYILKTMFRQLKNFLSTQTEVMEMMKNEKKWILQQ